MYNLAIPSVVLHRRFSLVGSPVISQTRFSVAGTMCGLLIRSYREFFGYTLADWIFR